MSKRYSKCLECGEPETELRRISVRGMCFDCSMQRAIDTAQQMRDKRGPAYEKWLAATVNGNRAYVAKMQARIDELAREQDSKQSH